MLQWEDRLRSHPYYVRAARNAISIYVQLYDDPNLASEKQQSNGPHDAEKRKAAKKAKKAAKKQEDQQQNIPESKDKDVKKDEDPKGELLVKTDKPLEVAVTYLKPLQELSPMVLETQILSFEVHFRRGRIFLFPFFFLFTILMIREIFPGCGCVDGGGETC